MVKLAKPSDHSELPHMTLLLRNNSTFVIRYSFCYQDSSGTNSTRKGSTAGTIDVEIDDIPIDISNAELKLDFVTLVGDDPTFTFKWNEPLLDWGGHVKRIYCTGEWPGNPNAQETKPQGWIGD